MVARIRHRALLSTETAGWTEVKYMVATRACTSFDGVTATLNGAPFVLSNLNSKAVMTPLASVLTLAKLMTMFGSGTPAFSRV
ncbi:hypothetical protein D3C72_1458550 [compost metagenome]